MKLSKDLLLNQAQLIKLILTKLIKKYNVKDYLPQEVNQEWFDYDIKKSNAGSDKMINTDRYVIGVNTVGQSLRNASYDSYRCP